MTTPINVCQIWGGEFEAKGFHSPKTYTIRVDDSPRAGGGYEIDQILTVAQVPSMSDKEKAKLTTWLVDQRLQGNRHPQVTREVIELARNKRPLPAHERAERLLRYVASLAGTVSDVVGIGFYPREFPNACAWSESTDWNEIKYFINYLEEMGWIERVTDIAPIPIENAFRVTVAGYGQIAELETNVDSSQVFVAMWFDPKMDDACDKGIMPAIEDAGYKPLRIDRKPDVNKIDDEIIAEIRRSKFIVADFTQGEDGARGAVYFEAGFASGLGLRVLYTCRKDKVNELAFDTRQHTHILWETPEDLRISLKNHIMAVFGEGPIKP